MRKAALALIGLTTAALAASAPVWAAPARLRQPVLVELFTAQGCSACAKTAEVLEALPDKPPVLTLTFGVDYWDYLGWTDTFAQPAFSARQRDYMGRLSLREVYTPQVVVDGRLETAATSADAVEALVAQADRKHAPAPNIQFAKDAVTIGAAHAPSDGSTVWLVRYDPHDESVAVKAGDNHGLTVIGHNVVKQLARLGPWRGRPHTYALPAPSADGLASVVLVQGVRGGHILAVGRPDR